MYAIVNPTEDQKKLNQGHTELRQILSYIVALKNLTEKTDTATTRAYSIDFLDQAAGFRLKSGSLLKFCCNKLLTKQLKEAQDEIEATKIAKANSNASNVSKSN